MSKQQWLQGLESELASHNYMTGVERAVDRIKATGEIFTPDSLVIEMVSYLDVNLFGPGKTVLDPACGDGQFLLAAKYIKMNAHGMSEAAALQDIYGVDIMRDNVDLCRRRLGGGTIIMGNTLDPSRALDGQTPEELDLMLQLFDQAGSTAITKKEAVKGRKPRSVNSRTAAKPEVEGTLF